MQDDVIGEIPAESCGGSVDTEVVVADVSESPGEATFSEETPERLASERLAELIYRALLQEESTAGATPRDTPPVEPGRRVCRLTGGSASPWPVRWLGRRSSFVALCPRQWQA